MRFAIVVALLLLAARASASPLAPFSVLDARALTRAEPGAWAEYLTVVGGHPVGPWVRILALGPAEQADGFWIEVWISQRPGSATQAFRMLLVDDPGVPGGVAQVVGRILGGPPQKLPLPEAPPAQGAQGTWVRGAIEAVQTSAGTIRARRAELIRDGKPVARAWLDAELPILGLARLELASGVGLELYAFGRGGIGVVDLPGTGR